MANLVCFAGPSCSRVVTSQLIQRHVRSVFPPIQLQKHWTSTERRRKVAAAAGPIPVAIDLSYPERLVNAFPNKAQPYLRLMRVHKPAGIWTLFWPCSWSISLSASAGCLPDPYMLGLFLLGSFTMRSAGCIVNDLFDQDIDKMVERTKLRPLASGELTDLQAVALLGGLLSVSLGILLQLNWYSVLVGASSLVLVFTYPLAKRYTYWPQFVLGLTFNWGAILGFCAVKDGLDLPVTLPLYAACLCWTLVYDTIYAHQDKTDDLIAGVKSTALLFGDSTKRWLSLFSTGMVGGLLTTGHFCDQTWPYYAGVAFVASHLAWQIKTLDINDPKNCWHRFVSNKAIGIGLLMAIVAGNLLKQ